VFRVNVLYGHPQNPDEFERYYFEKHLPLAMKIPGLMGFTSGQTVALTPGERAPYHRVASLYFENQQAAHRALGTPEGQLATSDVANFASGGVTIFADEEYVAIPVSLPETIR
jgi:uncharacterized protein (TIGR02118 family)